MPNMTQASLAIVIGGVVPALMFAAIGLSAKAAADAGIGIGPYVTIAGLSITVMGVAMIYLLGDKTFNTKSVGFTVFVGVAWSVAIALFMLALSHYNAPLSKLIPIHNAAPLIGIVFAFILFGEYKQVNAAQLLLGAVLVVTGVVLVTKS